MKAILGILGLIAIGGVVWFLVIHNEKKTASPTSQVRLDPKKFAAQVGDEGVPLDYYVKKVDETRHFFEASKQDTSKLGTMKSEVLDRLIDDKLVELYAKEKGIEVTDFMLSGRYDHVVEAFNTSHKIKKGGTDDSAFLAEIQRLYGTTKEEYRDQLRIDLLHEAVEREVGKPLADWLAEQRQNTFIEKF